MKQNHDKFQEIMENRAPVMFKGGNKMVPQRGSRDRGTKDPGEFQVDRVRFTESRDLGPHGSNGKWADEFNGVLVTGTCEFKGR